MVTTPAQLDANAAYLVGCFANSNAPQIIDRNIIQIIAHAAANDEAAPLGAMLEHLADTYLAEGTLDIAVVGPVAAMINEHLETRLETATVRCMLRCFAFNKQARKAFADMVAAYSETTAEAPRENLAENAQAELLAAAKGVLEFSSAMTQRTQAARLRLQKAVDAVEGRG